MVEFIRWVIYGFLLSKHANIRIFTRGPMFFSRYIFQCIFIMYRRSSLVLCVSSITFISQLTKQMPIVDPMRVLSWTDECCSWWHKTIQILTLLLSEQGCLLLSAWNLQGYSVIPGKVANKQWFCDDCRKLLR